MPKNRQRVVQPGAKSTAIRTKFKIGNRKSGDGAKQMGDDELEKAVKNCRKRDRNKLRRAWDARGIQSKHLPAYFSLLPVTPSEV